MPQSNTLPDFLVILENFYGTGDASHDVNHLWNKIDWIKHDDAPRHESWMNDYSAAYTYGRGAGERSYSPVEWNVDAANLRAKINEQFDTRLDCCFINGYEDERQHLGWHADDSPEMDDDRPIAVVSVGAERKIFFKKKGAKGPPDFEVYMPSGSCLVMLPGTQLNWEHKIPKHNAPCGKRISFTFRGLLRDKL